MGASLSQLELVKDIRSQGAVNGQDVYNSLMSKSLPTVSDLAIGDKVELFKHVRQAFQDKLSEITARPSNGGRGTPPVRETDIDDLLYAQIEIDQLIDDFRKVQDTGPLSVADLTKGVEHMFSKYDTDASGEIDATEFYHLMLDCLGEEDTNDKTMIDEVQSFMNTLDKDGNGLLDLDEFVAFVVSKLAATPEARRKFAEQSRLHAKLSEVIIALTDKISETLGKGDSKMLGKSMYSDLPEKMERRIAFAVEKLFAKYDVDKSQQIDANEFLSLMKDVMTPDTGGAGTKELSGFSVEDSKSFIGVISESGQQNSDSETSLELKRTDFIQFAVKVLTSSSQQRMLFASESRMHHQLLSFFLVLILDSLESVDSDVDREEFEKKERRAKEAAEIAKKKRMEEDEKKAAEMRAEAIRKADLEAAAIEDRVAKLRKDTESNNQNLEVKSDIDDLGADAVEMSPEEEKEFLKELAALEDFDDGSNPAVTVPEDPAERLELLKSRLEDYTSFAWSKYDIDKDGSLNTIEFEAFLRDVTGRSDVSAEDCRRFLRQMDQSGDGMIQREELVQFASSGFQMDPDDAKEYASRSSMHALLVIFVQKLEHTILYDRDFDDQHRAKKIVDEVWHKFDVDKSGTIEWNELKLLVSEVMRWDKDGQGDDPTDEEAKRFLQSMDTNGDGVLDREEFTAFVVNALTMNVELRVTFAQRSPMHAKLMVFVTNITERMWQDKNNEKLAAQDSSIAAILQ